MKANWHTQNGTIIKTLKRHGKIIDFITPEKVMYYLLNSITIILGLLLLIQGTNMRIHFRLCTDKEGLKADE